METIPNPAATRESHFFALELIDGNSRVRADREVCLKAFRPGRSIPELIDGLVVNSAAIIGALMPVEVVLISSAELEEVISFQHRNVVPEHVIFPVPETGPGLLRVHVVRTEILKLRLAALDFTSAPPKPRTQRAALY